MDLLFGITDDSMTVFQWGVVIGASLVASIGDLRERRIPNALTFPLLVVGLLWATWLGGLSGLGEAIGACLMLAVPYVFLFVFAGGGAGDAKLMGAIGTWLGLKHSVVILLCVATAGVVLALGKAIIQKRLKSVLSSVLISFHSFMMCAAGGRNLQPVGEPTDSPEQPGESEIPYGVAICAGVCAAAVVVRIWGVEWLW